MEYNFVCVLVIFVHLCHSDDGHLYIFEPSPMIIGEGIQVTKFGLGLNESKFI